VELSKFRIDRPHALRTPFEKWLHVLKFGDIYDGEAGRLPEPLQQEEAIDMALDAYRRARASDEVRELIEFRNKALHDEATRLDHAHRKGLEVGRQEGREEGISSIVRRMREQGFDADAIQRATGSRVEDPPDD